jgi:hypothetical protein
VTIKEVTDLLLKSPSKHCSLDPVPTWLLKKVAEQIAPLLCVMCNASFQSGTLPTDQKAAVVFPILKKPLLDPDDPSSYRPISNLSFVSKLVERLVASRFTQHCENNDLLPRNQSAYRRHYSTETAVLRVHNDLVRAADNGQVTALVLLDLSAAFDTVDHGHLLTVLDRRFGVNGSAHGWFQDYLTNRSQVVRTVSGESPMSTIDCGVPQGSVLGPLLFCSYTEDVSTLCDAHGVHHHLYADDKQLYASVHLKDTKNALLRLGTCVREIADWCTSRRLQLNAGKTELAWFGTPANMKKLSAVECDLEACGVVIKPSTCVRNLGVLLDSQLSLRQHVNKVASVCYFHLRRLRKIIRFVGRELSQQLISAFVLSKLDYCNSVLAGLPKSTIKTLQHVQNAAVRTILRLHPWCPVTPSLRELHWLPIESRVQFKLCVMMYTAHAGTSPDYISDLLQPAAANPTRPGLRSASSNLYRLPRLRLKLGERAFSYAGPKAWNALPTELLCLDNINVFKSRLKTHLFSTAFD